MWRAGMTSGGTLPISRLHGQFNPGRSEKPPKVFFLNGYSGQSLEHSLSLAFATSHGIDKLHATGAPEQLYDFVGTPGEATGR
jgi:hypothetical protein